MKPHPIDPTALISGLLFTLSGLVLLADQWWDDADAGVLTAAGFIVIGVVLAAAVVARYVKESATLPETD